MSTVDTSTWNPDPDLNESLEGIPLNSEARIDQTWQALRILMAAGGLHGLQLVPFTGATASADGASGLVPAPEAGDQDKVLKGDGTWDALSASDIPNLDASKITSGTIDIARLPAGALERLVTVADQTARYALTDADVQLGDTVKQLDTGGMYIVVDTSKLGQADGYVEFTAGSATSVPWSGVTDKPSTFPPSSHSHGSITNDGKLGTASRVVVTDGSKVIGVSSITTTKLGYLTDVTSNIQGQIDGKADKATTLAGYGITDAKIASGTITLGSSTITPLTSASSLDASKLTGTASVDTTGNAATATAFSVSKDVALTGAVTGTASSTGGWSVSTVWRSCVVGRSDSGTSNPWYKVASRSVSSANNSYNIDFYVENTNTTDKFFGILRVSVSTDSNKTISSDRIKFAWLVNNGFSVEDFVLVCPDTVEPTVELWTKLGKSYVNRRFTVISEGYQYTTLILWTLYSVLSAGQEASIPTAGTQVVSEAPDLVGNIETATKLATARTINGVSFDGSANITVADSTKVSKSGDTMTGDLTISGGAPNLFIRNASIVRGSEPASNINETEILGRDYNNKSTWALYHNFLTDGTHRIRLLCYKGLTTDNTYTEIGVGYDSDGNPYTNAPTPSSTTDSTTKIATTKWVRTATGNFACNAATATQFSENKSVTLTGDVTGTASSKAGWSIATTVGAITSAQIAAMFENDGVDPDDPPMASPERAVLCGDGVWRYFEQIAFPN